MERRSPSSEISREKYSLSIWRWEIRWLVIVGGIREKSIGSLSSGGVDVSVCVCVCDWRARCSSFSTLAARVRRSVSFGGGSSFMMPKLPKSVRPTW